MNKRMVMVSVVALALVLALTGSGMAWYQTFTEGGYGNEFDTMAVYMVSDNASFEAPGFDGFTVDGWTAKPIESAPVSAYQASSETAVQEISFNLLFSGNREDFTENNQLVFEFYTYLDGNQVNYAEAKWDGSGWDINPPDLAPVPIPGALLLVGAGLVRLAAYRRKRT
jgi:hypothetical protein